MPLDLEKDKAEFIHDLEGALHMWDLVHMERFDSTLSDPKDTSYDAVLWRNMNKWLEKLKS